MLPDYIVMDQKMDRLSREMTEDLQTKRLQAQVFHCYENTSFWRKKFDEAGLDPRKIREMDDLEKIPFCTKQELENDQASNPPFGGYLGVHRSKLCRYFATSGTTGKPLVRVYSRRDWRYFTQLFMRNPLVGPGDVVVLLAPTDGLLSPTLGTEYLSAMGAMVIRASRFSTEDTVKVIHSLKPKIARGTPSQLLYLADVSQKMNMRIRDLRVPILWTFGEPGGAIAASKRRLLELWGADRIIDGYGLTEIGGLGTNCVGSAEIHIANDFVIVEVIDPESGKVLEAGEKGELVFTNIIGETQPLLRYRVGDIGRIRKFGKCSECDSTATRIISIEGRVDEMIWYKGINIFPSAIENVIRNCVEISQEYEIVLDRRGTRDTLLVRAEVDPEVSVEMYGNLKNRLENDLLGALEGVHAKVELVSEGTLSKTKYKGSRVRDNRPKTT
jgi:phenylacetate-CoA ligase